MCGVWRRFKLFWPWVVFERLRASLIISPASHVRCEGEVATASTAINAMEVCEHCLLNVSRVLLCLKLKDFSLAVCVRACACVCTRVFKCAFNAGYFNRGATSPVSVLWTKSKQKILSFLNCSLHQWPFNISFLCIIFQSQASDVCRQTKALGRGRAVDQRPASLCEQVRTQALKATRWTKLISSSLFQLFEQFN